MAEVPYTTLNPEDNDTANVPNSRLLSSSAKLRNQLEARNLYAPNTEYPLQNKMYASNVVNAIGTIIEGITPFKSYNLKNTVYGRLITNPTPLTDIGLMMLGKQFMHNFASNLAQQTFPTIKVSNLFDGNKDTKLFTANKDLRITIKEDATNFENFVDRLFFRTTPTPHPAKDYPFQKNPTYSDYLKNTGKAQLEFMYNAANQNIYRPNNLPDADTTFYTYAAEEKIQILPVSSVLGGGDKNLGEGDDDKKYFDFNNAVFSPYFNLLGLNSQSLVAANQNMINSTLNITSFSAEYGHNSDVVDRYFGTGIVNINEYAWDKDSQNLWVENNTEFSNDAGGFSNPRLIWGRDGVNNITNNKVGQYRGDFVDVNSQITPAVDGAGNDNFLNSNPFNIKAGLLEYTRNLLIASEGQFVDTTRKAFTKNAKLVGFNGAGLWKGNNSTYAQKSGQALKTGVRQHNALDQYDRFAKAIRFNGNEVYGGNENSVIYKTVMPRIHPTLDKLKGEVDNKNLMFSIENLAVRVINNGTYGIMDDEYGSPIPICEVGLFGGRMMWFPPYDIEINEVARAKFEPTVMVGRNEPMYNYQNSERSATINFTLLVDYPPQLKNYRSGKNGDRQREIAEFFAFGGDGVSFPPFGSSFPPPPPPPVPTKPKEPEILTSKEILLVFPNDVPRVPSGINPNITDDVNTIVQKMWTDWQYNIVLGFNSNVIGDNSDYGYNSQVFFIPENSLEEYDDGGTKKYRFASGFTASDINQYTATGLTGQFGDSFLNSELHRIFNDEENRKLYSVYIYGGASQLYTEKITTDVEKGMTYNEALGKRRADTAINLVKSRLRAMFGQGADAIEVTYDPTIPDGSVGDTKSGSQGATAAGIPRSQTVQERSARILIKKNANQPEPKAPQLSKDDITALEQYQRDVDSYNTQIRESKISAAEGCVLNQRGIEEDGILHGFKSASKNYFYPVFHSQTPEDFHKRLTFLHQCTRQGAAIRYESEVNKDGILRARNSVFGRQPICILRVGDFFYTKIVIETVTIDYADTTWDMNPEGFGMQPMMAKITLQVKIIGGQSLKGPIDALQNAVSFNYYANSTFTDQGLYNLPSKIADSQASYREGILTNEQNALIKAYNATIEANKSEIKKLDLYPREILKEK